MNNNVDMISFLTLPRFNPKQVVKYTQLNTMVDVFKEAIEVLRDRVDYLRAFDNGSAYAEDGQIEDNIGSTYKLLTFARDLKNDVVSVTTDFDNYVISNNSRIGNWDNIYDITKTNIVDAINYINTQNSINYAAIININSLLDGITVGVIEDLKEDIDIIQQTYATDSDVSVLLAGLAGTGRTTETIKSNATAIAELNIDMAAVQQELLLKADLVNGTIPMDQLPSSIRQTNKGRFVSLEALEAAWPALSEGLESGDFATVGVVGSSSSEIYSYDSTDGTWETSGYSGTVNSVNNIDPDSSGNVSLDADDITVTNTTNKFVTQSEIEKISDSVVSSDNSVLDIVVLTQVEYDAIINKDEDTLYFIKETV